MAKILVVGLNPSWQKILEFDHLKAGKVNRARRLTELASGKGFNVARVLRRFDHEVWLLQLLGGRNGCKIAAFCNRRGIRSLAYETGQETRTCVSLVDYAAGTVTELIEPFSVSNAREAERRIEELVALHRSAWDTVLYSEIAPEGLSSRIYSSIHRLTAPRISILDAVHSMPEELFQDVTCVKVNRREFEELEQRFPRLQMGYIRNSLFLVTDGGNAARMLKWSAGAVEEHRFFLPVLANIRNPSGAGDAVSAGLAHFLLSGCSTGEAFRRALAMGSASCLQLEPADYQEEDYQSILSQVRSKVVSRS